MYVVVFTILGMILPDFISSDKLPVHPAITEGFTNLISNYGLVNHKGNEWQYNNDKAVVLLVKHER